ncbi:hypothetical protein [Alkalicoccobacillus plakortidis]|uniref:Small multi-drug export protein n=1 Tax=Alkalicoccobacillus plakortidis TaxID=444060 RepID=A0ABT0XL30_9BACI|nr:hypothetical protein [Alkalicoccobacillus plakortidis]MCM2676613.1 hypothetical protein [Alkalicoccobacillus plakortidis]
MEFLHYMTLFLLSSIPFVEIFITIPLGLFLYKFDPTVVAIVCFLGNATGIISFLLLYSLFEGRISFHSVNSTYPEKKHGSQKRNALIEKTFKRFGVFGAAIIIPMVLSSHLGVFFYRTIGVGKIYLLHWILAGLAFWTIVLTTACVIFPSLIR